MSRYPRQLSDAQIAEIRASRDSVTTLALLYGVNRGVISNARRGVTYKVAA